MQLIATTSRTTTIAAAVVTFLVLGLITPAVANEVADACPREEVDESYYSDVDDDHVHKQGIDCAVWWEVMWPITEYRFRPAMAVDRGSMAAFIAAALESLDYELPAPSDQGFEDIDGHEYEDQINQLAAAGIVAGKTRRTYAPDDTITRAQMTTFLTRLYERPTGDIIETDRDWFRDDDGNPHEGSINKAAEKGITTGTSPRDFSPNADVRRDQMASFLARTIGAAIYIIPAGKDNPRPIGGEIRLHDDWDLQVLSVNEDANDEVEEENQFNDPPKDGHQYVMVRVRATYRGGGSASIDSYRFEMVGDSGVTYSTYNDDDCGVTPDEFEGEAFNGGTVEGNICLGARTTDLGTLRLFDGDFDVDARNRRFLALY